ncbi:MAG: Ig-like domain-containing protein [Bacteroidetes bacterium]|nr:Ig-like domain-containing protein [Bacteroidota bacterium]
MKKVIIIFLILFNTVIHAQIKILFDATKAEAAGNADWVIDADAHNIGYSSGPAVLGGGNESNPQRIPTPLQSTITSSTVGTYWQGGLSSWGIDLVKKSYVVETLPYNGSITYNNTSNQQDLSNYKVFIVCEPNILFTVAEKIAILQFVQNGGGLFMISDHITSDRNNDNWDSPLIWNDLLNNNSIQANPFGIIFDTVDFSQTSTNVANLPTDTLLHGPMGNVTSVMWSNGTSMKLNTTVNPTVKGIVYKTGSSNTGTTNVMVARANYGAGKVVAIGDSSPCDDGSGDTGDVLYDGWIADASGNHERLIINATIWLANSPSTPTSVASVSILPTALSFTVGDPASQLTATILPSNATNQTKTWSSDNLGVASVSTTGLVTPVAAGNCVITVTTQDGSHTANCSVTVTNAVGVNEISKSETVKIFPNPFTDKTTFVYNLNESKHIRLSIYDITGREIKVLCDDKQEKGEHSLSFGDRNLTIGIYYYRISVGDKNFTGKLVLTK